MILFNSSIRQTKICCCSVTKSRLTLRHGLQHTRLPCPLHYLPEFAQTHVHWISEAVQPSHPLSSPSPPTFNFSQHHSLFKESVLRIKWPNIGVLVSTSVFPMNTQDWYPLGRSVWLSLQSKGLSRVFSNTTVQKHQFFGTQLFYNPTLNP